MALNTITAKAWVLQQHPTARGWRGPMQGRYHVTEDHYGHELGCADSPGEAWVQAAYWIRYNRASRQERVQMEAAHRAANYVYPRRVPLS